MKKTVLRVSSLLIAVVMLAGMALPSFAYYSKEEEWIDDYSDFPDSERYLSENISNYFLSAAYDLRNIGVPELYDHYDYYFAYHTTEEFYNSRVKRNEKGEIIVPPLLTAAPDDDCLYTAYAQGKTTLTPKMAHIMRVHGRLCHYTTCNAAWPCDFEKAAVMVFLAPWTLYQDGEFYTWKDIAEMSDDDLSKIDMSSYTFYKYITAIKDTLIGYGWWKEEYTERYNALYAHANDWINSLEDKSTFDYKGEKRYYAEITEEVRLYGSEHDMIMYSERFDMFFEEFENAVKNAPNEMLSSFAACYSEYITDFDLLEQLNKGGIWGYDFRNINFDWNIFMINYLKGDTKEFDEIYSSLYGNYCGNDYSRIPYYTAVYKYFKIHPISAEELEQEIIAQYGVSNILGRNAARKMADTMINGSLFDLADCYRQNDQFILDPVLGPRDISFWDNFTWVNEKFDCVDPERSLKQFEEAYEFEMTNGYMHDESFKVVLERIKNNINHPQTSDNSAVWFVIAVSAVALCAVPLSLRKKSRKIY